jgi:hypothetical protein
MRFLAALLLAVGGAAQAQPVDLALVLAVDVSESVDAERYALQIEGIARALESPRFVDAIDAGENRAVALLVMEWSDRQSQAVTVAWTRVTDEESAGAVAARMRRSVRSSNGLTAMGDALIAAKKQLESVPWEARRRTVDVSGDGMANIGVPVTVARDLLVAEGIAINGLPILTEEPWLEVYYNDYVIGGPGAFVIPAESYSAFAEAMTAKLVAEIAAIAPERRQMQYVFSGSKPLNPTEE